MSGQHSAEKKIQEITKVETEHRKNSSNTRKNFEEKSKGENYTEDHKPNKLGKKRHVEQILLESARKSAKVTSKSIK